MAHVDWFSKTTVVSI